MRKYLDPDYTPVAALSGNGNGHSKANPNKNGAGGNGKANGAKAKPAAKVGAKKK